MALAGRKHVGVMSSRARSPRQPLPLVQSLLKADKRINIAGTADRSQYDIHAIAFQISTLLAIYFARKCPSRGVSSKVPMNRAASNAERTEAEGCPPFFIDSVG
jgi:hypothetical protein